MNELRTRYLGFDLRSPIVASSSPLTGTVDALRRLEDAGAAAVVLPSLFAEQLGAAESSELLRFYNHGVDAYLCLVADAKEALSIPVIASLNASSRGGWVRHAALLEGMGADAIELNLYVVAADADVTAADIEHRDLDLVAAVRDAVHVPLAVKVGPQFSAFAHTARELAAAGADALVLFNRFYQPDIDLSSRTLVPRLELSTPTELRQPLRWIALLSPWLKAGLAASTGIHGAEDVAKVVMAGADVAMMTSAIILHGPEHLAAVEHGLLAWMDVNGFTTIDELRGSLVGETPVDPEDAERGEYMKVLASGVARYRR